MTTLSIQHTLMAHLLAAENNTATVSDLSNIVSGSQEEIMAAVNKIKKLQYVTFDRKTRSVALTEKGVGYASHIKPEDIEQPKVEEVITEAGEIMETSEVIETVETVEVVGISPEVATSLPQAPVIDVEKDKAEALNKYLAWAKSKDDKVTDRERIDFLVNSCGIMPIEAVRIVTGKTKTVKTKTGGGRAQDPNSKTYQFEQWMSQHKDIPRKDMIEYAVSVLGIAEAAAGTFVYNYNKKCKEAGEYGVSGDIKPTSEQWKAHLASLQPVEAKSTNVDVKEAETA